MTQPEPFRNTTPASSVGNRDAFDEDPTGVRRDRVPAAGPLMFLPFLALLVVGLWLLGDGFERGSGPIFVAGILAAGVSFLIPVGLLRD